MSGLVGHHGRSGNLGQIGSGEVLLQDYVITANAGIVNVEKVFTPEFRNYKTVVTDLVINSGTSINLYFRWLKVDGNTISNGTYRAVTGGSEGHTGGANCDQSQKNWNETQAEIDCAGGSISANATGGGWNAEMYFYNPTSTARYPRCSILSGMMRSDNAVVHSSTSFFLSTDDSPIPVLQGFQMFLSGSSVFVSGKFTTYGYRIDKDADLH